MKAKRFLLALLLGVFVFTGVSFAEVEDALTPVPEQSVYAVLKLDDAGAFLKWIFSQENIDTFMPLILASENSNEIMGAVEMARAFAENTPLSSVALLAGVTGDKNPEPFCKLAFTAKPEAEIFVKKIADGTAEAADIAKLLIGKNNPMVSLAESMIKVEKGEDNILQVDNELFLKAQDGMIVAGLSADDVKAALNALNDESARFFTAKTRRFAPKDFAWLHIEPDALDTLDEDDEIDIEEVKKYLEKPLDVEIGFMRVPGKFLMSLAYNLKEALSEEYYKKTGMKKDYPNVKGGHLNPAGVKAPLIAFGGLLNLEGIKLTDEGLSAWKEFVRQAKVRFGITEEDLTNLFNSAISFVMNDNVTVEGFKIPAVYISQTGTDGAAERIFTNFEKSPHFHKVQDGILQIDSSLSPAPLLVAKDGETLKLNLAELENVSASPELKQGLKELLETEASSALWLDFAAIQSWISAPENGVLTILEPLARFSGNGEIFDAFKEILSAKFSVPSMSIRSDSLEIIHSEFQIDEDVKAEDGLMSKIVKIARNFMPAPVEDKAEENTESK